MIIQYMSCQFFFFLHVDAEVPIDRKGTLASLYFYSILVPSLWSKAFESMASLLAADAKVYD
jgi:hypothetical protein